MRVYLVFASIAAAAAAAQQVIPFCSFCECDFENAGGGVDLDCTNTDMKRILLDVYFWYDDYNASYRVTSLKARNSNLEAIDREFPSSTLKLLDLSSNGIAKIADSAFSNLQNLEELDLSNNSLESLKPDVFKGMYFVGQYYPLKKLRVLKLNHNRIAVLHQHTFVHIANVEELYLGNNPLKKIGSSTQIALKTLTGLRVLDLSCAALETLPDDFFKRFKRLELVDLSENLFITIPSALQHLPSLETLFFNANPILKLDTKSSAFATTQQSFTNLRTLHLSYMPNLEAIHALSFSGLKLLDELHLRDNAFLSYISEFAFNTTIEDLPQLRVLDLRNCNLSRLSVDFLPQWKTLDRLEVAGNPWTCDCLNQAFIETVAVVSPEEAKGVVCVNSNKSFFQVKEEGVVLPCPLDASFDNFRSVLIFVVVVNVLVVVTCCLFRKRFKRASGVYVTLRSVK